MPYKSIDSFNLDEPCLVRFAHAIKNKNTIYYVLSYRKWAIGKGYWQSAQQMLDEYEALDEKRRLTHFNRLKEYLESKGTGSNDRRNTWFAVSRFYRFEHHPAYQIWRRKRRMNCSRQARRMPNGHFTTLH